MIKAETKRILFNSFEELVAASSLNNITVQDIVNNCGASRTTFYYHFKDKYDLMLWEFRQHTEEKVKYAEDNYMEEYILSALYLFQTKKEYYYRIASYEGQNSLSEYCNIYGSIAFQNIILRNIRGNTLPEEIIYSIKYFCSGSTFINMEWIKSGMKEEPDEIVRYIKNNIPDSLIQLWPKQ